MTRQAFLAALRQGLHGLQSKTVEEITADYATHFSEGQGAGRSEAEVAAALGDPARLARELKAEAGLRRWEQERNPSAAAAAVLAVLGLATLDILVLLPILLAIGGALLGLFVAAIAMIVAGIGLAAGAAFGFAHEANLNPMTAMLAGLGVTCLGVALGSVLIPIVFGLLNLLGPYGRLHYRLLQPALSEAR